MEPEAIGNPIEHTFANGAAYTFRRLSLRDEASVVAWVRSHRIAMAQEAFGPEATADERASAIRIGMKPIAMDEMQMELNSLETMLQVLWLSSDARRRTPPLSADEFVDSLGNVEVAELVELAKIAQGIAASDDVQDDEEDAESGPNSNPTMDKAES
jgi:hypothetical protein